jgi:DNA-binding Lrp family transcriptional regulator
MPDKVIIPESALLFFGHTVQCIFACVLNAVQRAADKKQEHELLHGVITYSHSEFAKMCGCSERTISDTLKEFEKAGYIESELSVLGYRKAQFSYVFYMPDSGKNETSHSGKNETSHSGKNDTSTDSFQHEKCEKNADSCKNDDEKTHSGKNDTSTVEKMELVMVEKMGCKENTSYLNTMTGFMSGASQAMPQAPEVVEKSGSENSGINESLLLDRIAEHPETETMIITEMRRQKALELLARIPD